MEKKNKYRYIIIIIFIYYFKIDLNIFYNKNNFFNECLKYNKIIILLNYLEK